MKQKETLALLVLLWGYTKSDIHANVNGVKIPDYVVIRPIINYLHRNGWTNKDGQLSNRTFKLLKNYGVVIPELKERQEEYERNGEVKYEHN